MKLRLATVVGGIPIGRQANVLRAGAEVVVATPGRLKDLVNVDPPSDHKDYLHRGGRTARAGESGSVVTLVTPNQRREMSRLMTAAGIVPQTTQVRSGEEALSRITGAQTPSGIPVTITAPLAERRMHTASSRGRRSTASAARRASGRPSSFDAAA